MGWEQFKDYMNSFIGALLLLISIILIPEIRVKKKYWISILGLVIILSVLGFDKINRDKREKLMTDNQNAENASTIRTLEKRIEKINNNYIQDSIKFSEFENDLKEKFRIIRDSTTNKPVKNEFNTKIDKAENVHIGPN